MSDVVDTSQTGWGPYLWSTTTLLAWRLSKLVVGIGVVVAGLLYWKQGKKVVDPYFHWKKDKHSKVLITCYATGEDSMLYFPEIGGLPRRPSQNPRRYRSPSEHQISFESHQIECSDGVKIHAWLLLRNENQAKQHPTLVFFHGNAGNIGLRLPNALQMMQFLNVNVLMVEYRGYGESDTVAPSEHGLKLDGEAALRFILKHPKIDAASIYLFGRSLGGAVAFHLAMYAQLQRLPLAGVIVENTFTGISEMVDHLMPLIAPLKALVLRIKWDSMAIVPNLHAPILYLSGARDELVPHSHMIRLYRASSSSKLRKMHVVKDGTHNETWMQGGEDYWKAIRSFMTIAARQTDLASYSATNPDNGMHASQSYTRMTGDTSSASSIPMMPSNILNIAQESMRTSGSGNVAAPANKKEL